MGNGITRQILAYDKSLMMVRVCFDKGSIGALHTHLHSQATYVVSGQFIVEINKEIATLSAGDSFYVAPNFPHSVKALEAGELIDTFSPMREDFINIDAR